MCPCYAFYAPFCLTIFCLLAYRRHAYAAQLSAPASAPLQLSRSDTFKQPCPDNWQLPVSPTGPRSCMGKSGVGIKYDGSLGCLWERQASYYHAEDAQVASNLQLAGSEQECCRICRRLDDSNEGKCNMWTWCGERTGCCTSPDGCEQESDLLQNTVPYQTCLLTYNDDFSPKRMPGADVPSYSYQSSHVSDWSHWTVDGRNITAACKAFTAGLAIPRLSDTQTAAQIAKQFPDARAAVLSGVYFDPMYDRACHTNPGYKECFPGNIEVTVPACLHDPKCSALTQPASPCQNTSQPDKSCQKARLKGIAAVMENVTFDSLHPSNSSEPAAYPHCVMVKPSVDTILFFDKPMPQTVTGMPPASPLVPLDAISPPSPPRGSDNAAKIAGGVAGGVAALLLAASAFLLLRRRKAHGPDHDDLDVSYLDGADSSDQGYTADIMRQALSGFGRRRASVGSTLAGSMSSFKQIPVDEISLPEAQGSPKELAWASTSSSSFGKAGLDGQHGDTAFEPQTAGSAAVRRMSMVESNVEWGIKAEDLMIARNRKGEDYLLGSGAFGLVYKAYRNQVEPVAVKVLKGQQDERSQAHFMREVELLRKMRHSNIVLYLGVCVSEVATLLITEFMSGGDLWTRLGTAGNDCSWYQRGRDVALDVAQGLLYLASKRILHGDIKSANVLLSRDGTAKIADVGLARILSAGSWTRNAPAGTLAWSAPEVLLGSPCSAKADVYSFGVLLWEIVAQEMPERCFMREIRVPEEAPEVIKQLIDSCMSFEPRARPDMQQVVT